jgi:phospho-N-acetylmuramoyl-pentapeptide-transferase
MLYYFLYPLHADFIGFNVIKYITFRTFGCLVTALILYLIVGKIFVKAMQKWQVVQSIRSDGPKSHLEKAGTPTMGGLLILGCILVATLIWMNFYNTQTWIALILLMVLGLVGFYDDYRKLMYGNSKGLPGRYKLLCQTFIAGIVAYYLYYHFHLDTTLNIPFFKMFHPDLGWLYIIFILLVVVGASNAVNLTDGLDGLATGPLIMSFATYAVLAYVSGHSRIAAYLQVPYQPGVGELAVFCGAVVGACIGFLWFNTYPADIFMGDVGSLSLGGALGLTAVLTKNEVLLVIVGGIFVLETVSVVTQVISFKLTGKRVFRMAPIHHHFELKGWKEPKVIVRFWIIAFMLSLLALLTLKLR